MKRPEAISTAQRLVSIDVLRGITIAFMFLLPCCTAVVSSSAFKPSSRNLCAR